MILPNKYIQFSQSYIGLSTLVFDLMPASGISIEKLWESFSVKFIESDKLQDKPSFQKFILVLDFMFLIGLIRYNDKGELFYEN